MHVQGQKEALRTAIASRLAEMTDKERSAESRSLCRRLLPLIPEGSTVCGYFPLRTEIDVRPLLEQLIERGDNVFLPCFENQKLVYRKATDLTALAKGALNVPEPTSSAEELVVSNANFVLVPARAFDRSGNRLGRGAGGYDQWIAVQREANSHLKYIGCCMECQLVHEVPMEDHDEKMDMVVTAREVIECE